MFFKEENTQTEDESSRSNNHEVKKGAKRKNDNGWGGEGWVSCRASLFWSGGPLSLKSGSPRLPPFAPILLTSAQLLACLANLLVIDLLYCSTVFNALALKKLCGSTSTHHFLPNSSNIREVPHATSQNKIFMKICNHIQINELKHPEKFSLRSSSKLSAFVPCGVLCGSK